MAQAVQPKYDMARNLQDRRILLATSMPMRAHLGTFGPFTPGQAARIKLRNVGVITGLKIRVSGLMTIAVPCQVSPIAPYNFLTSVVTQDYNTTQRVFAPGHMIAALSAARYYWPWMSGVPELDQNQVQLPTAVGAAQAFSFPLDIPFAYDKKADLTGAILAQTVVGEMHLNLQFANTLVGDATNLYTAGTATLATIFVDVWQDFLQPQTPNLPLLDLQTVYEFAGGYQSSDNLAAAMTKFIDYPNVRSVMSALVMYCNNGILTPDQTDVTSLDLIANANTTILQQTPQIIRQEMRSKFGGDIPPSMYYIDHRFQPIQTAIYGQVQMAFTPSVVNAGNTFVGWAFENTYPLNTPLPGIQNG